MARSKKQAIQLDHLGQRVEKEREAFGMSRAELAKELGITTANLWKIEKGQVEFTADRAKEIARILGISVARLFGEHAPEAEDVKAAG